jgi:hypothetical protein
MNALGWIFGGLLVACILVFAYSLCKISGECSRWEEREMEQRLTSIARQK